jgi:hypothetical protein
LFTGGFLKASKHFEQSPLETAMSTSPWMLSALFFY